MRSAGFISLMIFFLSTQLFLQGLAQSSANQMQYLINPSSLAPTLFEKSTRFSGFLTYRSSWTGFEGKPSSALIDISGVVNNKMYVGGEIRYQTATVFRSFYLSLKYALQLRLHEDQYLTLGINGVLYQNSLRLSEAIILDPNDPLIQGKERISQIKLNLGAGVSYRYKTFIFSIYAPMLLSNTSAYDNTVTGTLSLPQNMLVYTSLDLIFEKNWILKPTFRANILTGVPSLLELSLLAGKRDLFWFAALFRSNMMMGLSVGGQLLKHLVINYGYEFYTGNQPGVQTGFHEITLGYKIGQPIIIKPELRDYLSAPRRTSRQ